MSEKNDFLQPLLDMMSRRMDDLSNKIDANTATTTKVLEEVSGIKSEVDRHDGAIKRLEVGRGKKPLMLNPNVMYLIALGFVMLLAIIAAVLHVNVGGILK